jgi:hypothetical protein
MRNCKDYQELFSPYLDGYLKEDLKKILESHLKICENCRNEFEKLTLSLSLLKNMEFPEISPDFSSGIFLKLKDFQKEKIYFPLSLKFATSLVSILIFFLFFLNKNFERENIVFKKQIKSEKFEISQKKDKQKNLKIEILKKKKIFSKKKQPKREIANNILLEDRNYFESVLRVSLRSQKEENLKLKIFTPQEINWEGRLKEGEVLSLLIPVKIEKQQEREIKVKLIRDENCEYEKNFKVLFSNKKPKICKFENTDKKGYVLIYAQTGKEIDCSKIELKNEINFREDKDVDVYVDSGFISFAPFNAQTLSLVPSVFGNVKLLIDGEPVEISDFQTIISK